MIVSTIKQAAKTARTGSDIKSTIVTDLVKNIKVGGEKSIQDYCLKLDDWTGNIPLSRDDILKFSTVLTEIKQADFWFANQHETRCK